MFDADIILTSTQNVNSNKWYDKKLKTIDASRAMYAAGEINPALMNRAAHMSYCGDDIEVEHDAVTGQTYVKHANLCRDRLCPTCSWRLAVRRAYEMQLTADALLAEHNYRGIMLTLTVRSCRLSEIRETIKSLCEAFIRLRKHRAWQKHIKGYCRSIELTHNPTTNTYHPHIHAILLVDDKYRATDITQRDFAEMWRIAARLDYVPVVDVRYAYVRKGGVSGPIEAQMSTYSANAPALAKELVSAIVEAVKYAIKPDTLGRILASPELAEIAAQLSGHHLISYGGCIRSKRNELGFSHSDEPSEDVNDMDDTPLVSAGPTQLHRMLFEWSWATSEYVFVKELPNAE